MGLSACTVRILAVLYTSSQVRVLWGGLVSDYFPVSNGVISRILFCVYVDDLQLRLSSSGVRTLFRIEFCWGLGVCWRHCLIALTPSAKRILLHICDSYAAEYDINFIPDKYKFLVIPATERGHVHNAMCNCCFFVGNKMIDNVDRVSHVGHIITSSLLNIT